MKRIVSGIMLILLLTSILTAAFNIQPAKASGTIYIRADGSIDPLTAPMQRDGDIYTLTSDAYDSIAVERGNTVLIGKGHTLQGTGDGAGISIGQSNVTIKDFEIRGFLDGIYFEGLYNICICENNIIGNLRHGIYLNWQVFFRTTNHIIERNRIVNNGDGIHLYRPLWSNDDNLSISDNYIAANSNCGINLYMSANNTIVGNTFEGNHIGFMEWLSSYSGGRIYHNNFISNDYSLFYNGYTVTSFDDGYPSGGNYWSDYTGTDANGDGIGDTPYVVDKNNQDRYPLMRPWTPVPQTPTDKTAVLIDPFFHENPNRPFIYDLAGYLLQAGYSSWWITDSSVTVDWLKTGLKHGVVFWRGHTASLWSYGVALLTGEIMTPDNTKKYKDSGDYVPTDLSKSRLDFSTDEKGKNHWTITRNFIDYYYRNNEFPNSLVLLEVCNGLEDSRLAQAFVSSGAGACVGYTEEIAFHVVPIWNYADQDAKQAMYDFCCRGYNVEQVVRDKKFYERGYYGNGQLRLRTDMMSVKSLFVSVYCPVDLYLVDPCGKHVGVNPITHEIVNEIPDAMYVGSNMDPEVIWIPAPVEGDYRIALIGTDSGLYNLTIEYETKPFETYSQNMTESIIRNVIHYYSTNLTADCMKVAPLTLGLISDTAFNPTTLSLRSGGQWVTSYIELPAGYSVADINISSILFNDTVIVSPSAPSAIGDYDNDGIPDLMVKFDRAQFAAYILNKISAMELIERKSIIATLILAGNLDDGTPFQGSDTIKIVYIVQGIGKEKLI